MSALVIDFASAVLARRGQRNVSTVGRAAQRNHAVVSQDFTFWRGASGMRYVHTIYQLLSCPELPDANIVLARRTGAGDFELLHVGRVEHGVPSLNLAEVRRKAAELGAGEIHVHFLAGNPQHRLLIENDLLSAGEAAADRFAS